MTIAEAVAEYLEDERARGLRPSTLKDLARRLRDWMRFSQERNLAEVTAVAPRDVRDYIADAARRAEGRAKTLDAAGYSRDFAFAVKRFFAWATRMNLVLADPTAEIEIPRVTVRLPRNILTLEEMKHLLAVPDVTTAVGLRNRALLEMLYSTGLRCRETTGLNLTDVDLKERRIFVGQGKRGKERVVPVGAEAANWMGRYVEEARPLLEWNSSEPAFFLGEHGARLSPGGIQMTLRDCRSAAGIEKWISPHSLRHTCATHLVQSGADIRYVQELLGHTRVTTTEIYTRVAPTDLEDAHRKHHPRGAKEPATP